jgi:hypothetical protein
VHWKRGSKYSQTQFLKISKHKNKKTSTRGNLSSKSSESGSHHEGKFYRQQKRLNTKSESANKDKNYNPHKTQNFKNVKVKAMKMRKVKALTTRKAKSTAKVNEVKAIEKTLTGLRREGEKQVNKKIGSEPAITLPPHFTNMFNNPVFIYIIHIYIHNIYHFYF